MEDASTFVIISHTVYSSDPVKVGSGHIAEYRPLGYLIWACEGDKDSAASTGGVFRWACESQKERTYAMLKPWYQT